MKTLGITLGLLGVLASCLYLIISCTDTGWDDMQVLEMHCAAGLQKPVEEVAQMYEAEYGVDIKLNFGGSGQLLVKLGFAGGDLYLPADDSYITLAREQGLITESIPVSKLTAGIIVPRGNPKNIHSLQDLKRADVKVVIAERSAAVGKHTHQILESATVLESIESGIISKMDTVYGVALQVELGASDAGIVWDGIMNQFKNCEFVRVPEFEKDQKQASIGILRNSKNKTEALKFARYLTAKDKGAEIFRKHGFDVQPSSVWSEHRE